MSQCPRASYAERERGRRETRVALLCALLSCLMPHAQAAGTLPAGGHFVDGSGSIGNAGSTLNINQTSGRGVVNWDSFSIGGNNHVVFANDNGIPLNRVTGRSPSAILGMLTASGRVLVQIGSPDRLK